MFTAGELLQLVESIYAGILDPVAWEAAVAGLCRAFDGEAALLVVTDNAARRVRSTTFVDIDRGYRGSYFDLCGLPDMDGFYAAFATYAHRGALTGAEVAQAAADFHRSRFHDEWLRAQNVMDYITAPLAPTPAMSGGLNIGRPRRGNSYGEREVAGLCALRPHLLRACQARLRLDEAAETASGALAALDRVEQGVVLVDARAAVVHANRAADALLSESDGLGAPRAALACDHPDDTAALRQLVGQASARSTEESGRPLAVRRRSGRRPLSVLVAPLRDGQPASVGPGATALVLVKDPEATIPAIAAGALRVAYALTPAEARTAAALLDHSHLADVAESLGVSLATVRTLLQRTFDKTGTHTQAELVRLMLAHRLPAAAASAARTSPPP